MFLSAQQKNMSSSSAGMKEKVLATRPMFLSASILPVIAGTAIGYHANGAIEYLPFILALAAVICVNLAINLYNDVFDDINGTDAINAHAVLPFTGGSRAIQNEILTREQMRKIGFAFLLLSMVFGFSLFILKGHHVLAFGLLGVLIGIAYSAPPLALSSRGLGELAICFAVGVLPVIGASWLQTGKVEYTAMPVALAIGLWVMNIILINEVPDRRADEAAGKRTLAVRFSNDVISSLYLLSGFTAVVLLITYSLAEGISFGIFVLPVLLLPVTIYAAGTIQRYDQSSAMLPNGIKMTIALHAVNCIWITIWIF